MGNQIQKFGANGVEGYDEMHRNADDQTLSARSFKEQNTTIISGKPKKTTAESQLLFTKILTGLIAVVVILLLVVVLIALPKTMKLMDNAEKTIESVDQTIEEATGVIEDIEVAVNSATDVIESIDIDGVNQSIESLNTVSTSLANIFSIFK